MNEAIVKGELHEKMKFHYMVGFGLVSGVVKVFLVSFLFLGKKNWPGTTRPDDEMRSLIIGRVTYHRGQDKYLYTHDDRKERSRDQFEIPFRHQGTSFLVDFLAKERELTKKTFTTPLTSPNPNVLIPKTIGNRKRDCAWGCARG